MRVAVFCVLATLLNLARCELYSAIEDLADLIDNDEKIIEAVRELTRSLEGVTRRIKVSLKNAEEEHTVMESNPHTYIENPLNAFLLFKRLSHDVSTIQEQLKAIQEKFTSSVEQFTVSSVDLTGAIDGIYRLQSVYGLTCDSLAKGMIYNKKYRKELTVDDLLVLGREMAAFEDKSFSKRYLKLAKEKNSIFKDIPYMELLEKIFSIYNANGMLNEAVEVLNEILEMDPSNQHHEEQRLALELKSLFDDSKKDEERKLLADLEGSHFTPIKEKLILRKACRGELQKSIEEASQLHCRYLRTTHFTTIAPFKIIEANLYPLVVIFLDVISEEEIEVVKSHSKIKFARAEILVNSTAKVSSIRVAKLNWQSDWDDKVYRTLTNRVGDMSGLNMRTAEMWQIQNYGIGGHYNAHYDFTVKGHDFNLGTGNRIATALFYLSDVELGGATVFPFLRIYVPPKKGTAVYWLNLSTSGHREYFTRHAACPLIIGSKWVANKWYDNFNYLNKRLTAPRRLRLHEYGQEFTRPCELTEDPTDDLYYTQIYALEDFGIYV